MANICLFQCGCGPNWRLYDSECGAGAHALRRGGRYVSDCEDAAHATAQHGPNRGPVPVLLHGRAGVSQLFRSLRQLKLLSAQPARISIAKLFMCLHLLLVIKDIDRRTRGEGLLSFAQSCRTWPLLENTFYGCLLLSFVKNPSFRTVWYSYPHIGDIGIFLLCSLSFSNSFTFDDRVAYRLPRWYRSLDVI